MLHPAYVDGRYLVVLRRRGRRFSVVASGLLEYDGEALALVCDGQQRVLTDPELAPAIVVRPDTQIVECCGFDLFLIEGSVA